MTTAKEIQNKANPCMKCGSVECAICWKDLKKILKKQVSELRRRNPYDNDGKNDGKKNTWDKWLGYEMACDEWENMQGENNE